MASILDQAKFTFTAEQIRAVNELVFEDILEAPEIALFHTVFPNIVTDKEIGFVGEGGLVGVANQGCDPEAQNFLISTRLLKWEPTDWEVLLHECWKDLKSAASVYSLDKGTAIKDFTTSDYMTIVTDVLGKAMRKFIIRLVWFSDTDAENVTDGGIITDGVDVKFFTILDGLWKQIETQLTSNPAQRVTIAENAGASYAAQALDPDNVQGYLTDTVFNAPILLRQSSAPILLCTQTVYDAYSKSLRGLNLSEMYVNLTDGIRTLTFDGKPLIPVPIWDEMILAFENTGVKLHNPHRIVFTTKSVLGIGVDKVESFGELDIWYDRDSRKVKIEAMGVADTKLMNPALMQVAI